MPPLIAGAVVAGMIAVLKVLLRPSEAGSSGVSRTALSFFEDLIGLIASVVAFVPLLPLSFVAFLLLFYYRVKRRRGRRFGGLRILGD